YCFSGCSFGLGARIRSWKGRRVKQKNAEKIIPGAMRERMGYRSERAGDENPGAPASLRARSGGSRRAGRDAGAPRVREFALTANRLGWVDIGWCSLFDRSIVSAMQKFCLMGLVLMSPLLVLP